MAESLVAEHDVTVAWAAPSARLLLQCAPDDAGAVGGAVGIALPDRMLRAAATGGWDALRLAPDEWLLVGAPEEAEAVLAAARAATTALSLVDVSDRTLAVEIAGAAAETLLAAGCPLDLAGAAFPVGACSRTLFGKAPVMLWRRDRGFWLDFARSYADYVVLLLQTAARDLG